VDAFGGCCLPRPLLAAAARAWGEVDVAAGLERSPVNTGRKPWALQKGATSHATGPAHRRTPAHVAAHMPDPPHHSQHRPPSIHPSQALPHVRNWRREGCYAGPGAARG
jgi:hypothetical protein